MRYPKELVLTSGEEAVIRPLENTDRQLLVDFYQGISSDDRWYLRYNFLDPKVLRKWFDDIDSGTVRSIVALSDDTIIAHASLYLRGFGSTTHVGRLRIMVAPRFRHKRLGTWMLLDLIQLAMDMGLTDIRSDFVAEVEAAAIDAAFKLDFFKHATLTDYAKDPDGNRHDLVIMIKRLHRSWSDF